MKTAIITGGSAGIGAATAERFLADGYSVFNVSRRPCPVDGATSLACDLSDPAALAETASALLMQLSQSESACIVHNASQMMKDAVDDCDSDQLRQVLETNLVAANSLNQHLVPALKPGSSVIYIGSTLSEKAVANTFSYVISKHATLGMMRATCQDLMGRHIHTALVCPGFTDTEMLRSHLGNDEQVMQSIGAMNGFNRLVEPGEIADLIWFAHNNPAINGSILHANLGQRES